MARPPRSLHRTGLPGTPGPLPGQQLPEGQAGRVVLDNEEIEPHPGVVVYVPRGVKHQAIGKLTVLTVSIPGGVLHDVHELE